MHLFWMFWVQPMFHVPLGGFSLFPKITTPSTSMGCFFSLAQQKNTLGLAGFSKFRPPQPSAGGSENPNPSTKCGAFGSNQSDEWQ